MAASLLSVFVLLSLGFLSHGHDDFTKLVADVSQASNTFGVNLYRTQTRGADGKRKNIFLSPLSVFTALAMVNAGARGETAYQLQSALNWNLLSHPGDSMDADSKMGKYLESALRNPSDHPAKLANKLWLQKYFCTSFCKNYTSNLVRNYKAELEMVDFNTAPEQARQYINNWVAGKTNGKIKNLMESGSINSFTRLVITNAIYFKSNWKYKFDKAYTFSDNFYVSKEKAVKAKFMTLKAKLMLAQDADNLVVEIPYHAPNLSMIVILPRERFGIRKLELAFTDTMLRKYLADMKQEKVNLFLPKFKLDSDIKLKDFLRTMGVVDLFDPYNADLSGIAGYLGLYVSHAVHDAFIEVNEEGSEAAAATGISASFRSIDPELYMLFADHPFMFVIVHRPSATMLFNGEVVDPTVKKSSSHLK